MGAFVALAGELNFGRAAKRLGITQPALSQKLQRLERELDTQLVIRTSREISLTAIGELYLNACRRTLAEAERASETVSDANRGLLGRLIIGCLAAGANGQLPDLIRNFRARAPRHFVELHHFPDSAAQERNLLSGSLDIAVVRSIANDQAIVTRKLSDDEFVVYMPQEHHLAQRSSIKLTELANEPMVLFPRRDGPAYFDLIIQSCRNVGFEPRIEAYGTSLEAQLGLVAAGLGVSLQAESNRSIHRAGVNCVPLEKGDLVSPLWIAYRRWHRNALVDTFVEG